MNYQDLNNLTIKNWYPFLLLGKALNYLSWTKQFIQLDLTSAYHWMRIQKGNEWKTAFYTRYGYMEYQVMLFGLSNTSSSFQDYIN